MTDEYNLDLTALSNGYICVCVHKPGNKYETAHPAGFTTLTSTQISEMSHFTAAPITPTGTNTQMTSHKEYIQ